MVDNQHKQIIGFNDLTQAEIDLMNEVKRHEQITAELLIKVMAITRNNWEAKLDTIGITATEIEYCTKQKAEIEQQQIMAVSLFEHAFMRTIRSVAHPDSPWLNVFGSEKETNAFGMEVKNTL